jgi:uncharacterized membrane protein YdjX (TVP38/TMEM64 family)
MPEQMGVKDGKTGLKSSAEKMKYKKKMFLRISALLFFIFAGSYLFIHYDLHIFFSDRKHLIDYVNSFGALSVVVFIGLQILQVLFAPIPGEVTGFIGGYIYGSVLGTIYSTIGLTIGSWLAFMLARWLGLPFVEKAVNPSILNKYDYFMEHQGKLITFIFFLIPGFPKDALCYVIGLSHMPTNTFLLVSVTGRLLGTAMLSVSGDFARYDQHGALWVLLAISLIFCAVAFFYRERWLHKLRHHKPPRHKKSSK